jgi:transcriptional regulator with XRE-family HTH domain
MKITDSTTDPAVLAELGRRLALLRLEGNRTQHDVALAAGVGGRTMERVERNGTTTLLNFVRILRALGLLETLDRLIPSPAPSPMTQLALAGRTRRRASGTRVRAAPDHAERAEWHWRDQIDGPSA